MTKPGRARQRERLGDRFERLSQLFGEGRVGELMDDPNGIAPERALVFEVAGRNIADFAKQAQQIGLEYLLEDEDLVEPSEDFRVVSRRKGVDLISEDKQVPVYFYLGMPSETALRNVLRYWNQYQEDGLLERGRASWKELFDRLIDLRAWGPKDRVPRDSRAHLRALVEESPELAVSCEIEFWFSDRAQARLDRSKRVRNVVLDAGGSVIAESLIRDIRYHAMLASLPAKLVDRLAELDDTIELLKADEIMFVRPQSVASAVGTGREDSSEMPGLDSPSPAELRPLVAVLDGLPVQNHRLLVGRLDIDDPDGLESRYATQESRAHGTAIASLIVHGDTNRASAPLGRRIYVRPVMCCEPGSEREHFPKDQLLLDVIFRAVRRMFEGEGGGPPAAPGVRVINISLGDASRPFARQMSPWARLLDHLAWHYKVLFVVSAGNTTEEIYLPSYSGIGALEDAVAQGALEADVLNAVASQRARRSLLSPAEAINALAVGARHEDALSGEPKPAGRLDPFFTAGLPSVISRLGLGFRGAVKPEILVPGGRSLLQVMSGGQGVWLAPSRVSGRFSGIGAASPDQSGRLDRVVNMASTSTAAALGTRQAHRVLEHLIDSDIVDETDPSLALYPKALLVHHAHSQGVFARLNGVIDGPNTVAKKRDIAALLGFGPVDHEFPLGCETFRATLLGSGALKADRTHRYTIPAPEELSGLEGWRAITVSVAWFSPVNPRNQMYRAAKLEVKLPACLGASGDGVPQPDPDSRGKGTVFHTRIQGDGIVAIEPGGTFAFDIECIAQTSPMDEEIPYVVAVSLEVGPALEIDVYARISQRLRIGIR